MRVSVDETVDRDLLEVGAEQVVDKCLGIGLEVAQRPDLGDLGAVHHLHGQHARRRVVVDRGGNDERVELAEVLAERDEVACLAAIVEFACQ